MRILRVILKPKPCSGELRIRERNWQRVPESSSGQMGHKFFIHIVT